MTPQQWVEQQLPNMEAMLKKLVVIPSVQGSPTDQAPYGKAPLACLEEYLRQAKELGFDVSLEDQRMGEVRWGAGAPGLAILGHLDVVPGWTEGNYPSYELSKEDGVYYGRGVIDDKGPMVSALFALYYFLDQGISLKTPVLLLAGTDEENGSSDLEYYRKNHTLPSMVITPDASYPLINGEKGMLRFILQRKVSQTYLSELTGGEVVNGVPQTAGAEFVFMPPFWKDLPGSVGEVQLSLQGQRYTALGKNAHASTPELGENALTALWQALADTLPPGKEQHLFRDLSTLFPHGKTGGEGFGLECSDPVSGRLTLNPGFCQIRGGLAEIFCDVRFPLNRSAKEMMAQFTRKAAEYRFILTPLLQEEPHYTPQDSKLVSTLLKVYQEHTGQEGRCISIGGGTYVHNIPGGVAFGMEREGFDYRMHGADERLPVQEFLDNTVLYIKAIEALCAGEGTQDEH